MNAKLLHGLGLLCFLAGSLFAQTKEPGKIYLRYKPLNADGVYAGIWMVTHHDPWFLYLPDLPAGGKDSPGLRVKQNVFSPWADISAGFAAGWGTIVLKFFNPRPLPAVEAEIQLAGGPDESAVFKTMTVKETGNIAGICLSPGFREKPADIVTVRETSENHLKMAESLHLSQDNLPQKFSFYTDAAYGWKNIYTDPAIAENELRTLRLLGLNGIGYPGDWPDDPAYMKMVEKLGFSRFISYNRTCDPAQAEKEKNFSPEEFQKIRLVALMDEPGNTGWYDLGQGKIPVEEFHTYLKSRGFKPSDFNASDWPSVLPVRDKAAVDDIVSNWGTKRGDVAKKLYYWTNRFTQSVTAREFKSATDRAEKLYSPGTLTFTNFTDHPLILGGSMVTGGGIDWFTMGLARATTLPWSEDWLYGSIAAWGNGLYQRLGYVCDILRVSGSRDGQPPPLGYYITDENDGDALRMKAFTVIGHGVKTIHFFDYGPAYAATENYWSDSPGEYEGIAKLIRDVGKSEYLVYPGEPTPAQVAIVYSTTSEIWNQSDNAPAGQEKQYLHIALAQDQYPADVLNEDLLLSQDLSLYKVIYLVDTNLPAAVLKKLKKYAENGGCLCVVPGAGVKDEYDNPVSALADALGLKQTVATNGFDTFGNDTVSVTPGYGIQGKIPVSFQYRRPVLSDITAKPIAAFSDGSPAILEKDVKKGKILYYAFMPGLNYFRQISAANPKGLVTVFPDDPRELITLPCRLTKTGKTVELSPSEPIEADLLVSGKGAALVLVNMTRTAIGKLGISVKLAGITSVSSIEKGKIPFQYTNGKLTFSLPLGLTDIVLLKKE
jgi:hypothetical protein